MNISEIGLNVMVVEAAMTVRLKKALPSVRLIGIHVNVYFYPPEFKN